MTEEEQKKTLREAARVVKPRGEVHIWDCQIDCAYPEPFCIDVEAMLPERRIKTTYGVGKWDTQSLVSIKAMCTLAGLKIETTRFDGLHFYIKCRKV